MKESILVYLYSVEKRLK